jgi:hypothetical protein
MVTPQIHRARVSSGRQPSCGGNDNIGSGGAGVQEYRNALAAARRHFDACPDAHLHYDVSYREAWGRFASAIKGPAPTSTLLVVKGLANPDYLLEIDAVAVVA